MAVSIQRVQRCLEVQLVLFQSPYNVDHIKSTALRDYIFKIAVDYRSRSGESILDYEGNILEI